MGAPRGFLAAAAGSDGRIYAIGGVDDGSHILNSVDAYDPVTDIWADVAPMPTARFGLAAAVDANGTIYALGGNNGTSRHLDTAETYDPTTHTWSTLAPMPTSRRDLAAAGGALHGIGTICAIGGHGFDFPLTTVEVFIP